MTDQELFWGTDQYDFSVEVPAAGLECFWHFAHRGERFYLSFMVQWVTGVGHDRHLSVTVNAPSSFYQMCFSNFHNRFGTMQVFLSFGVYYDGYKDPDKTKEEEKKKKEEASKDLNNTLSVIESIFNYVTWWSATQSLVIIVSGYLQLFTIKRLFKTNSGGPRC
nr:transmembrane emp24 domain-containing protein 6-like [Pseudochaenichthys georgianus]